MKIETDNVQYIHLTADLHVQKHLLKLHSFNFLWDK